MTMHIEDDDGTIRPAVETFQWRLEQRIAELEAALAERTKERDAAIAERDMTRLYCAEVASYVCNPIYDKVENREGIAADAKAMATGEMVAHYNDIKKQTKRAIRAEAERDAAIRRAEAMRAAISEYLACVALMRRDGCPDERWQAALAAIDAARAGEER